MVDVDRFKEYNDQYGHSTGDEVLKETASILNGAVRKETDWVARSGGDEFVVVLGGVAKNKAEQAVYSVRERINKLLEITEVKSPEGERLTVSLSIGHTRATKGERKSVQDLLTEADKNMYEEKEVKKKAA